MRHEKSDLYSLKPEHPSGKQTMARLDKVIGIPVRVPTSDMVDMVLNTPSQNHPPYLCTTIVNYNI